MNIIRTIKKGVPVSHTDTPYETNLDLNNQETILNYNISDIEKTNILKNNIDNEIEKKFFPKKLQTIELSKSYERLGYISKSIRVKECGTFLEFIAGENKHSLHNANFCRDRLCPLCSWRRSYKIFGQVSKIMNVIQNDYEFIFLTLTVPNVKDNELALKIDEMQKAWINLTKYNKRFKNAVVGYFKALEVTHNKNKYSKSFDTYHPHYHLILAVDKRYYKTKDYIKHSEWLEMWRKYMKDESITQVDVRRCTNKDKSDCDKSEKALSSAVAEVAKYATKSSDYIIPWSDELTDSSVNALLSALSNRRLCSFGGIFDKTRKLLKLEDIENGDLIHLDDTVRSDVALQIFRYSWSCGIYKLVAVEKKLNAFIETSDHENI